MYLTKEERDRRYGKLREAMAKEGMGVLLIVGNNHGNGRASFSTGSFRYLTEFFITSQYGMLLFFLERDPIMLVPSELQEIYAKKYSWVEDVRFSPNYVETVVHLLEENTHRPGKVGIAGMDSIPASTYLSLREKLPGVVLFDATSIPLALRFVKSEEEKALMKKAAKLNDEAYKEVLKRIRPGIKEYEIVGVLEGYQRRNGADRTYNLISSGPFPTSKDGVAFQGLPWHPGHREIERGDCILLEITSAYGGYWNQLVRMVSVGGENPELARFQKTALKTLGSGFERMQVGLKTIDFFATMAKTAETCGFKLTTPMGHFAGLDLVEDRVDTKSQVVFVPGIAFIVHPNIADSHGIRILWGQTYFMTDTGPINLNDADDLLHTL